MQTTLEASITDGIADRILSEEELADVESDAQWSRRLAAAPPVKDPMTRLLDLLDGWSAKAQRDAFPDDNDVIDSIAGLYQEAGQFAFDYVAAAEDDARIRQFLLERVLPVLTRRVA